MIFREATMNNYITIKPSHFLYNLAVQGFLNFVNASKRGKIAVGEINSCQSEIILEGGNVKIDFLSIFQNYDSHIKDQFSDFEELKTHVAQHFGESPEVQDKHLFAYFIKDFLYAYSVASTPKNESNASSSVELWKLHNAWIAQGQILQNFFRRSQKGTEQKWFIDWLPFMKYVWHTLLERTRNTPAFEEQVFASGRCSFCGENFSYYPNDPMKYYYFNNIFCSKFGGSFGEFPNGFWHYDKDTKFAHSRVICKLCQFILMFQRFGFSDYVLKLDCLVSGRDYPDIRLFLDCNNLQLNFELNQLLLDGLLKLRALKNLNEVTLVEYLIRLFATTKGVLSIITLKGSNDIDVIRLEGRDLTSLLLQRNYSKLCSGLKKFGMRHGKQKKMELSNSQLIKFLNEVFSLLRMPFDRLLVEKIYPDLRDKIISRRGKSVARAYLDVWEALNT